MTDVISLRIAGWNDPCRTTEQARALEALERGNVLLFPRLGFALRDAETRLLCPSIAGEDKNISLDPSGGMPRGSTANEADLKLLEGMMRRFAAASHALLRSLLPRYRAGLRQARTSFRPVEIAGRTPSWRKDDTRLHVDSFPSSPTMGNRILRVFTNVNPRGEGRHWRLGDSFEDVARRYLPAISGPVWGSSRVLKALGVTKSRRSAYDHFMLRLHDRMKADLPYQQAAAQSSHDFSAGSTWCIFTDQVSHAAMTGQHALEQTFHLPVTCMRDPSQAPLRVLERLLGRELA